MTPEAVLALLPWPSDREREIEGEREEEKKKSTIYELTQSPFLFC